MSSAREPAPDPRWSSAAWHIARGRYAYSLALLDALIGDRASGPCNRSLGLSARASVLRQVASPDAAGQDDEAALIALDDVADTALRRIALADATVGRAADRVARGDLNTIDHLLAAAEDAARVQGGWRVLTRLHWVRAEAALAGGRDARAPAQAAVDASAGRSHRHHVKSRLIRGVAALTAGDRAAALGDLKAVAAAPYPPLHWVTAVVLVDVRPRPAWGRVATERGHRAARAIATDLPEVMRRDFVHSAALQTLRGPRR